MIALGVNSLSKKNEQDSNKESDKQGTPAEHKSDPAKPNEKNEPASKS